MIFAESIHPEERYTFCAVFGKKMFFYEGSSRRIIGWETPMSFIFQEGSEVQVRFKQTLEAFGEDFPSAIRQYKKERRPFLPSPLSEEQLRLRLAEEPLLSGVYPLELDRSFFDASCYWMPIDIDSILTDLHSFRPFRTEEAAILSTHNACIFGRLGFDQNFYRLGTPKDACRYEAFRFKNGVEEIPLPAWLAEKSILGNGYRFLKGYVITPSNLCYTYDGNFLENKSRHHQNARFLNDLIKRLMQNRPYDFCGGLYSKLVLPAEFLSFSLTDAERILIPHLATKNLLNETAAQRFLELKKLLEKAGLSENFETAFRNIADLNKSALFGGSKRNICGLNLLKNLQKLSKREGSAKMAALLEDQVALKIAIAKINGIKINELLLSEEGFAMVRDQRRVPKELKKNPAFKNLSAGSFLLFSNEKGEKFCAVTTSTKTGLGLNRI